MQNYYFKISLKGENYEKFSNTTLKCIQKSTLKKYVLKVWFFTMKIEKQNI